MSNNLINALDPTRSVVVEACAGSGKTWLLVSRIIRLLLDGSMPSQILAITFTRKAAQEMQERLRSWLRELAVGDDAFILQFFADRGLSSLTPDQIARARSLYGIVLLSQPGISINTFHSWFMQVLQRAPLSSAVPQGVSLLESESCLQDEAWEELIELLRRGSKGDLALHMQWLFNEYGLFTTRNLLDSFMAKRTEWKVYTQGQPDSVQFALENLKNDLAVDMSIDPVHVWGADSNSYDALMEFVHQLATNGTASQADKSDELDKAWMGSAEQERFNKLFPLLFTQAGEPRKLKATKNQDEAAFQAALAEVQNSMQAVRDTLDEQQTYRLNEAVLHCGAALLDKYESLKSQKQQIDFSDLEWQLSVLLQDSAQAETMQFKLDSRYRHVLLDEFQDTNPIQWHIMRSWFDASVAVQNQPKVFIVGDPKQSIYRFRRADSRLFGVAREYLVANFKASVIANSMTRRNAQPIVDAVNGVFAGKPDGFEHIDHTTFQSDLSGHVLALPLIYPEEKQVTADSSTMVLRDPLTTARKEKDGGLREKEAAQFAELLETIVGEWQIRDAGGERTARYEDIMVLVRNRTHLQTYEEALRAHNIPFISSRRGGLLDTLEAEDIQALLRFLITPFDDVALAQVLRCPVFACKDSDLMHIASFMVDGGLPVSWWERMSLLTGHSEELARAAGLLQRWLDLSDRLPVHDLLDRIFDEGDVETRYRAAMPEEKRVKTLANLSAFMELALQIDAGRFPSLPRFLQVLSEKREFEDDSPDEAKLGVSGNAVRIYTVHEAKGLEAPIVWLLDANAERPAKDGFDVLVDWPSKLPLPLHFSMYAGVTSRGKKRGSMFEQDETQQAREEMNLLYVAMTRAKQALIISGISKGEDKEMNKKSPTWYDRISAVVSNQTNPLKCATPATRGDIGASCLSAGISIPPYVRIGVRSEIFMQEAAM